MTKAAVSLISLEPVIAMTGVSPGKQVVPMRAPEARGMLAALAYDSLGDLLSQVQDGFQPVHLHRAATAHDVVLLIQASDAALLFGEISRPEDAFQVLLALKLLKDPIRSGQVRVIVNCTLASKTLLQKLRSHGCTEIVSGLSQPNGVVQKARMLVELLLFRRAVARLPGGKITSIGLAFMLSEWIAQNGVDYPSIAHLYCACLSAACGGARFELMVRGVSSHWNCAGTSDNGPSRWLGVVQTMAAGTGADAGSLRIGWIGGQAGALVCPVEKEPSLERERLLQAAADLAIEFVLFGQSSSVLRSSGLKS